MRPAAAERLVGAMPRVSVSYLGMIRRVVGKSQEEVELAGAATLGGVIAHLADMYGQEFRDQVLEGDDLGWLVTVLIEGVNCHSLGGMAAPLQEGQRVDLVLFGPPAAGG